ncbi:hypothetical protein BHE74_00019075 [Ensete ventricosum]|nr:hypothetical protein BHE74_00019075 [Ensete ventricosum]
MFSLFVYCEKEHMLIAYRSIVVQRYHHLLGTNLQRDHRSVMLWNLRMQEISLPARENDDMVLHSWKQRIPCKGKKISRVEGRSTVVLAKAEGFGRFGSVASDALRASSVGPREETEGNEGNEQGDKKQSRVTEDRVGPEEGREGDRPPARVGRSAWTQGHRSAGEDPMDPPQRTATWSCGWRNELSESMLELVGTESPLEVVGTKSPLEVLGTESLLELVQAKNPLELVGIESPLELVKTESPLELVGIESSLELVETEKPARVGWD